VAGVTTTPTPVDDQFTSADWSLFLSVAVIWGASFLFIDIGLDALAPGVITLMRVGLGALALAVLPLPRQHTKIRPEDRLRLVTVSVVWVAIPFTLFPIAEQHVTSAVAGLLNGGTPIFDAIFAKVLLGQPTRGAQLLGIAAVDRRGFERDVRRGAHRARHRLLRLRRHVGRAAAAALRLGEPDGQGARPRSRGGVPRRRGVRARTRRRGIRDRRSVPGEPANRGQSSAGRISPIRPRSSQSA